MPGNSTPGNLASGPTSTIRTSQYIWVMRIFTAIYILGAILFFFMPDELFYLINIGPRVLKIAEEIPIPSERFWLALTTSMMVMLAICSAYSSIYPRQKGYLFIHIASKVTSVTGFLYLFLTHHRYFAYLVGAITDSLVILVVGGFFIRSLTVKAEDVQNA